MKKYYCYKFLLLLLFSAAGISGCDKFKDDVIPAAHLVLQMQNDYYVTTKNQAVQLNVLANDSIRLQAQLTFSNPKNGTIQTGPDGTIYYQPNLEFIGRDSLIYEACLGAKCATATVFITVNGTIENTCILAAANDVASVKENTSVNVNVLLNDTWCNGTLSIDRSPVNGRAGIDSQTQKITYSPNPGFTGSDNLVYKITGPAGSVTATLFITVTLDSTLLCQANAFDDNFFVTMNSIAQVNILQNDTVCFQDLVINPGKGPQHGTALIDPVTKNLIYKPARHFIGHDELTYTITGQTGPSSAKATFVVSQPFTQPCTLNALHDSDTLIQAMNYPQLTDTLYIDVLKNDFWCPSNPYTITPVYGQLGLGYYGQFYVKGTGRNQRIVYYTNYKKYGTDVIRYTLTQGNNSDTGVVVIHCK